jgi:hypothetical protein
MREISQEHLLSNKDYRSLSLLAEKNFNPIGWEYLWETVTPLLSHRLSCVGYEDLLRHFQGIHFSFAHKIYYHVECQDMLFPLAGRICGHIGFQRYAIPIAEKICDLADCQDTMFPLAGEPVIILVAKVRDSRGLRSVILLTAKIYYSHWLGKPVLLMAAKVFNSYY